MERYFREAKHAMVGGGANEIQRSIIAKEIGTLVPEKYLEDFTLGETLRTAGRTTERNQLARLLEPVSEVEELLGSTAIHHNSTASRRTSSSRTGFSPR